MRAAAGEQRTETKEQIEQLQVGHELARPVRSPGRALVCTIVVSRGGRVGWVGLQRQLVQAKKLAAAAVADERQALAGVEAALVAADREKVDLAEQLEQLQVGHELARPVRSSGRALV